MEDNYNRVMVFAYIGVNQPKAPHHHVLNSPPISLPALSRWVVPEHRLESVKSLSRVRVSATPTDCSPPGSSIHGDSPGKNTGVGGHFLLQGIFPTQGTMQVSCIGRHVLYR